MMKMNTSICIISGANLGGYSANAMRPAYLAKGLKDNGFDVMLVIPEPSNKAYISLYSLSGIDIHEVPIKMGKTFGSPLINQVLRGFLLARIARKMQDRGNLILQFEHSLLGGCGALLGCSDFVLDFRDTAFESPLFTEHPLSALLSKILFHLEKLAAKNANKIITVSNSLKKKISIEFDVPEGKIAVIPPGFSEQKIIGLENIEEVEGMITFVGTLTKHIDFGKIIELARSLSNGKGSIYVVGDGEMRGFIEKRIKELNLNNIILTGWLPELEANKLIARSQVVILPLKETPVADEAFPIKGIYYAVLGKAIVIDNCEMARELKSNKAALISDRKNVEEFIRNVHIFLKSNKMREQMGLNAKKWAENFTWFNKAKDLGEMYETLDYAKTM